MAENTTLDYILRGLQLLVAPIVIGTDAYAIHGFRGYNEHENSPVFDGDTTLHVGVPAEWGFLMFCAAWTVLVVVWRLIEPGLASRPVISYVGVLAEVVAVLSWLAGFIAVAVNVATKNSCLSGQDSCNELKVAAAFGGLEWLLFMLTAIPAVTSLFDKPKRVTSS